jgi:hypothetical protein
MPAPTNPVVIDPIDYFFDPAIESEKISELQKPPRDLADFEDNLVKFVRARTTTQHPVIAHPADRPGGVVERVIDKAAVLATLDYFEKRHCLCLKVCFGLDDDLNVLLVTAGSFVNTDGDPTPEQIGTVFEYKTSSGRLLVRYLADLARPDVLSKRQAQHLKDHFAAVATKSTRNGYMLDIATYRKLLTDADKLGSAQQLRLRFGMNNTGDGHETASGLVQIMMVEVAAADGPDSPPFYLCDTSIKNDDTTLPDCPPTYHC